MKKRFLLALAALSFCGFASAEEYWIIKDGQLDENAVQKPYTPKDAVFDTIIGGATAPDGTISAKYVHDTAAYKDVRFDLSAKPLDLTKTWILHIEYCVPTAADSVTYNTYAGYKEVSLLDGTKAAFRFGFDSVIDSMNVDAMHGYCAIQGAVDAIEAKGAWMTKEVYVFSTPGSQLINSFVMSYAREVILNDISNEPIYIKNLGFVDRDMNLAADEKTSKPFYAEDFSPMGISVTGDGSAAEQNYPQEAWHGGVVPANGDKTKKLNLLCTRVWDKPYDASKIYATENNHAAKVVSKDVVLENIAIPAGYTDDKIQISMLIKYCALGTATDDAAWLAAEETPVDKGFNVSVSFDTDATLTPLYADSVLQGSWRWETVSVNRPAGATSLSLTLGKKVNFSYYVNQILVGAPGFSDVDESSSSLEDAAVIYFDGESIVAEGATKVEVLSLNGVVLASANGSSVNASGLADGAYIVRAFSANGVTAKTIIKK